MKLSDFRQRYPARPAPEWDLRELEQYRPADMGACSDDVNDAEELGQALASMKALTWAIVGVSVVLGWGLVWLACKALVAVFGRGL